MHLLLVIVGTPCLTSDSRCFQFGIGYVESCEFDIIVYERSFNGSRVFPVELGLVRIHITKTSIL